MNLDMWSDIGFSHGECWYFIRKSTTLGIRCKFLSAFCCPVVPMSVQFQSLCIAFRYALHVCHPMFSLGLGWCSTLQFSSQSLGCRLGSDMSVYNLGVSPKVYAQLYWIAFLHSFHSSISSTFSGLKHRALVSLHCTLFPIIFP